MDGEVRFENFPTVLMVLGLTVVITTVYVSVRKLMESASSLKLVKGTIPVIDVVYLVAMIGAVAFILIAAYRTIRGEE